ncbi:MAG: class I adenylate-forming enzyme family protein [Rhodospirillales bacterium]|nr:class I adenylate-forming enzyme family protein [Rhodospirillales bacterium]
MNFGYIFDKSLRIWPDKEALIYGEHRVTYAALEDRTNQVANGLKALGVGKGDHVAILVKNDHRFAETLLGALRTGASVTPTTTRAHYNTLVHIMADCGAKVLFASSDFVEEAPRLGNEVANLEHVLLMETPAEGAVDYDQWLAGQSTQRVETTVEDTDIAYIAYTSGSTGVPKGVLLTHAAVEWAACDLRRALLYGPDERCLLAVPMFHANGMFGALFSMLECGGSVVILHDVDPAEMIRAIAREKCTYTTGVPAMYKLMLREDEELAENDCSSLKFVICGSSEVPEDLLAEFSQRMAPMLEAYGLTECSFVCTNPRWGITKQGTTGLPYPGIELRVVDPEDTSKEVPQGEMGELLINSPGNLVGYHNLPDVTADRLLPGNWLRTHDIVRADEDGYIEIVGRQDDRIACAGEMIYPKEVENVLMEHPNVSDVAVVPMPDDVKGEVPVAFVVEKKLGLLTADELKQFFFEHGAAYTHPRKVFITDALPLTGAKKVDRIALKKMALNDVA